LLHKRAFVGHYLTPPNVRLPTHSMQPVADASQAEPYRSCS
jgi:hypothetical protein